MVKKFFRRRSIGIPYVPSVPSIFFLYDVNQIRPRVMDVSKTTKEAEGEIPRHISDIISRASRVAQIALVNNDDANTTQVRNIDVCTTPDESCLEIADRDANLVALTLPSTRKKKQNGSPPKVTPDQSLKRESSIPKRTKSSKESSTGPMKLQISKRQEQSIPATSVSRPTTSDSHVRKEDRKSPNREHQKLPLESNLRLNLPDTGFNQTLSSTCPKHSSRKYQEERKALPTKPQLCDTCTTSMLAYISVLQDFLKSMAQDISNHEISTSPCLECAKERLMFHDSTTLEKHVEGNVGRSPVAFKDTFDEQVHKSGPPEYQLDEQYKQMKSNGRSCEPTGTDSRTAEIAENTKSNISSENHPDSLETQMSSVNIKDESQPTLQLPCDIDSNPHQEEEMMLLTPPQQVGEGVGEAQQASLQHIHNEGQMLRTPSPSAESEEKSCVSQQVGDLRHYHGEEPSVNSQKSPPPPPPLYAESEPHVTQKYIQPFDHQSPPSETPYIPVSPITSRGYVDGILSTLSNEEREVYDSARGRAGWERLNEPHEGEGVSFSQPRTTDEAFVTMAGTNAEAMSCLVLGSSLLLCRTTRVLCVLITDGVSAALRAPLSSVFHVVQTVRSLDSLGTTKLSLLDQPDLGVFFGKLHVWRLVQFSKCVFLNPDIVVVQNCDELFCHEELSAVPDIGWPDCFNSGMFVYKPSVSTFWKLVEFAEQEGSYDGGDQGLLNGFFNSWSKDIHKKLSFIYNLMANVSYTYSPAFRRFGRNVKVVQFQGAYKPWHVKFYSETGQISQSVVHPTYVQFVHVWINIFRVRVLPLFSQEIQSYATSQSVISSSELLRFFPSEAGTELDFLLTPPSVRTRHDPQIPIPIVRNPENAGVDSYNGRRKSLTLQTFTDMDSLVVMRKSFSEENIGGGHDTPKQSLYETSSTGETVLSEQLEQVSQLETSHPSSVTQQEEKCLNLIPGSDLGDYQGMAAWEQGRMDYMGSASSEVILKRLHFLMEKSDRLV